MTIQEFIVRTGFRPSMICFDDFINEKYMYSVISDKDEWCKQWKKNGGIQEAFNWVSSNLEATHKELDSKCEIIGCMIAENNKLKHKISDLEVDLIHCREASKESEEQIEQNVDIADILIGKAHAYNDTDFRNLAIKMIGEKRVVLRTLAMELPLFDEDRTYLSNNLN